MNKLNLKNYIGSSHLITCFGVLAWRIPWTEEPGELQSMESQRVGHDKSDLAGTHTETISFRIKFLTWKNLLRVRIPRMKLWCWTQVQTHTTYNTQSKSWYKLWVLGGSVQFSQLVVSNSLWPHGLQHARPPCPSPTPGVYSNSCPLSWWCHPTISSSVIPFSSHLPSFPASGSFQWVSSLHRGQSIGVSASTSVQNLGAYDASILTLRV